MARCTTFILAAVSIAALSACSGAGDRYPSLAIRGVERMEGTLGAPDPSSAPQPSPLSESELERIARLRAEAAASHEAFVAMLPGVRSRIAAARGVSRDSDAWAAAQIAYADLESARSRTALALGEIDMLYIDATLEFSQREAIIEARTLVAAMINEEDRTLDALQ